MRVTSDPVLLVPDGSVARVVVGSGSNLSYGRGRATTPNSVSAGSSAILAGPVWGVSSGAFSEVTVVQPGTFASFEGVNGVTLFLGAVDPAAAAQDGDVWIDTT